MVINTVKPVILSQCRTDGGYKHIQTSSTSHNVGLMVVINTVKPVLLSQSRTDGGYNHIQTSSTSHNVGLMLVINSQTSSTSHNVGLMVVTNSVKPVPLSQCRTDAGYKQSNQFYQ